LDSKAVLSIYEAKERPLTDPVICHVLNYNEAKKLIEISNNIDTIYKHLTDKFWPGPLTIVTKASDIIPDCVTANTGFVGVRSPNHKVARDLIEKSQLPIAAPSANKFGHVSPTTAQHVYDDLSENDVLIIDSNESCDIGIESTVLKIEEESNKIYMTILRKGGISKNQIEKLFENLKFEFEIEILTKIKVVSNSIKIGQEAPGIININL
jgi:L-threonylcarbamoyladenylate synthase